MHAHTPDLKLFCNLNGREHVHRCQFVDELHRLALWDRGYCSWLHTESPYRNQYEFQHWQEQVCRLPSEHSLDVHDVLQDLIPPEFVRVVFHAVTETTVQSSVIDCSEKTWACILLAQPFVVLGTQNLHAHLRAWGFELYDELFDYGFDGDPDWQSRLHSIVQQIDQLDQSIAPAQYEHWRARLRPKALRNQQRAFEMIRSHQEVPHVAKLSPLYTQMIRTACANIDQIHRAVHKTVL